MANNIVKEFENLQVLTTYDFHTMDQLVQDLTQALEEARSKSADPCTYSTLLRRYSKKRRGKKRRSSANHWEHGNISEASESSLDEALKDYMENVARQSDSDDFVASHRLAPLSFPVQALSLAESDSVTENFSPMRPHRRRRRCKRMAIDAVPDPIPDLKPKHKRLAKVRTLEAKSENIMDIGEGDSSDQALCNQQEDNCDTLPGKRKRGSSEKTDSACSNVAQAGSDGQGPADLPQTQESSSSLSSSESDMGIFTNDEGREGDDEHSDFFHEGGPACGVPGIIPWWESEKVQEEEDSTEKMDPTFEKILTGSFDYMCPSSKTSYKARLTKLLGKREIRAGRRRLKDRRCYNMMRYMQERQQWADSAKKYGWCSQGNGASQSGEIKRRRKTPPPSGSADPTGYVGENADPIPENNIGNRMLQQMGWTPGTGLGADRSGIKTPILAHLRPKRKGLCTSDDS